MMAKNLERAGTAGVRGWWGRRSRAGRVTLLLLGALMVALVAESVGVADAFDTVVIVLSSMGLVPLVLVLGYRWFFRRFLWKVRNRLILTYLLMGLAPVVRAGGLLRVELVRVGLLLLDLRLNWGLRRRSCGGRRGFR